MTVSGGAPKAPSRRALAKVRAALRDVLPRVTVAAITPRARLVQDLGVDSLHVAELSLALEQEFGRPIFLGDLFGAVEHPERVTVAELALFLETDDGGR